MEWMDKTIKVDPPKRPKKITATRFASILGLNPWSSPFTTWCEITKTWQKPFEDTIYTVAGKTIEPKQIDYMRKAYAMSNLRTPTDLYGTDYFNQTHGDFFGHIPKLGGMWDSLLVDENGHPIAVLEFKTTKRSEDWANDVPEYYALQAALYAHLLALDKVIMIASFLEESDYENPEDFVPSAANTITVPFKVSERYPNFEKYVAAAEAWWDEHVETGVSPEFDEKKDAEALKALRTNTLNPTTDIAALLAEAEMLKQEIDAVSATVADKEKRLKKVTDLIKAHAMKQFRPGDTKVTLPGAKLEWALARSESTEIDKAALEADGLLEKYSKAKVTYRLTNSVIKPPEGE